MQRSLQVGRMGTQRSQGNYQLILVHLYRYRARALSKPTPSSGVTASHLLHCQHGGTLDNLPLLAKYSLKICHSELTCLLGSGTLIFWKMLLSGTEVPVKTTILKEQSALHEARVMASVCRDHPNLPIFIGVYDHNEPPKPPLVMKFYSYAGRAYTLHKYLQEQSQCHSHNVIDWARIPGICNGLDAIHKKGLPLQ